MESFRDSEKLVDALIVKMNEMNLEFLWHTALWASEDYVRGVSDGMVHEGSAPLDAHGCRSAWGWQKKACISTSPCMRVLYMAHHVSETASQPGVCRRFVLLFPYRLSLRILSGVKMPCMFNFKYMLGICSLLFIFMFLVRGGQTSGVVAGSIGVKNPHIKIGILASVPKSSCTYVKSCPIVGIGWCQSKGFSRQ